jgi:hypothetical protein
MVLSAFRSHLAVNHSVGWRKLGRKLRIWAQRSQSFLEAIHTLQILKTKKFNVYELEAWISG